MPTPRGRQPPATQGDGAWSILLLAFSRTMTRKCLASGGEAKRRQESEDTVTEEGGREGVGGIYCCCSLPPSLSLPLPPTLSLALSLSHPISLSHSPTLTHTLCVYVSVTYTHKQKHNLKWVPSPYSQSQIATHYSAAYLMRSLKPNVSVNGFLLFPKFHQT